MDTRQKILDTALQLFNEKGYTEVGVREIARAMNISPGNLSYHFSKKEDMFFELLKHYSQNNDQNFNQFFVGEATLERYLNMMWNMLSSQYKYRGIFIAFSYFFKEIQKGDRLDYAQTYTKREHSIRGILSQLHEAQQIRVEAPDIEFLFAFLSLFGRFSIQEAFMLDRTRKETGFLHHYLTMLTYQMSLFATEKGKNSIDDFRQKYLMQQK